MVAGSPNKPDWEDTLRHSRYRVTPQRRAVLDILRENRGEHLSAEEIHNLARDRGQDVSLTTIYRTLHLLCELNLAQELEVGEDRKLYEIDAPGLSHSHFICRECGRLLESAPIPPSELGDYLPQDDIRLIDYSLQFFGYCATCRERAPEESSSGSPRPGQQP